MRDFAAKQNSNSDRASVNIKRETSVRKAEEACGGIEKMSGAYREKDERLYLPESGGKH